MHKQIANRKHNDRANATTRDARHGLSRVEAHTKRLANRSAKKREATAAFRDAE